MHEPPICLLSQTQLKNAAICNKYEMITSSAVSNGTQDKLAIIFVVVNVYCLTIQFLKGLLLLFPPGGQYQYLAKQTCDPQCPKDCVRFDINICHQISYLRSPFNQGTMGGRELLPHSPLQDIAQRLSCQLLCVFDFSLFHARIYTRVHSMNLLSDM